MSARKKTEKRGRHEERENERKRRFGVNAIISQRSVSSECGEMGQKRSVSSECGEMGQKFSLKLFKNKMALSKTSRDCTRLIGGARAWWVVEQFRAASSLLFHVSNLTFLFVVHARNRHDLRSHVLVGNTTLRRRPCIGS